MRHQWRTSTGASLSLLVSAFSTHRGTDMDFVHIEALMGHAASPVPGWGSFCLVQPRKCTVHGELSELLCMPLTSASP